MEWTVAHLPAAATSHMIEPVKSAKFFARMPNGANSRLRAHRVSGKSKGVVPKLAFRGFNIRRIPADYNHVGAFFNKSPRRGEANSRSPADNDNRFI